MADLTVVPCPETAPTANANTHPVPVDDLSMALLTSCQLHDDNWVAWESRMTHLFERHGLLGLVTGAEPAPAPNDITAQHWHTRDRLAQFFLVVALPDPQLHYVLACPSAASMWQVLVAIHAPETWSFRARAGLHRQLYTTTLPDGEDVDVPAHITQMCTWRHRLMAVGGIVDEESFKEAVVASLPPSWREGFMEWGYWKTEGVSIPELIGKVNEEYRYRHREENLGDGSAQRTRRGGTGRVRRGKSSDCEMCGRVGHVSKDCWFNPVNRGKGRVNKGPGKAIMTGKERTEG